MPEKQAEGRAHPFDGLLAAATAPADASAPRTSVRAGQRAPAADGPEARARRERRLQYFRDRWQRLKADPAELARRRAWREANRERLRELQRRWRERNPTYMADWKRARRAAGQGGGR